MNKAKMEITIAYNEAHKYATEKSASIRKIKGLHGTTQLMWAFLAGVEWQKKRESLKSINMNKEIKSVEEILEEAATKYANEINKRPDGSINVIRADIS